VGKSGKKAEKKRMGKTQVFEVEGGVRRVDKKSPG